MRRPAATPPEPAAIADMHRGLGELFVRLVTQDLAARLDRLEGKVDALATALADEKRGGPAPADEPIDPDRLYTAKQIAGRFGVTPQTIYLHMDAGRLRPAPRGGLRARRVRGVDLLAFLAQSSWRDARA